MHSPDKGSVLRNTKRVSDNMYSWLRPRFQWTSVNDMVNPKYGSRAFTHVQCLSHHADVLPGGPLARDWTTPRQPHVTISLHRVVRWEFRPVWCAANQCLKNVYGAEKLPGSATRRTLRNPDHNVHNIQKFWPCRTSRCQQSS